MKNKNEIPDVIYFNELTGTNEIFNNMREIKTILRFLKTFIYEHPSQTPFWFHLLFTITICAYFVYIIIYGV